MDTAVITTGGLGTREATITKSIPKTMLPLYTKSKVNEDYFLKPLIEIIFENLYDNNFRNFYIIVSSNYKKIIKDHLTNDKLFLTLLKKRSHQPDKRFVNTLQNLYKKIDNCNIHWVSQDTPMGFGHALLSAKKFVGNNDFLLHAGDTYFPDYKFLPKLINLFEKDPDIACNMLLESKKLLKGYGIAQTKRKNNQDIVFGVEEKPKEPKSCLAILPVYAFQPTIFDALKKTSHGYNRELQITDAIGTLIHRSKKITSVKMKNKWFDIGSPERYFEALNYSFKK
jgi:UTP--glucose-1-phosphate uridylyltransferase